MRLACDTGGTFTDLMVALDDGTSRMYKSSTVPDDPAQGVLDAAALAAAEAGVSLQEFLGGCELLIHGTTHAINAIVTGRTARTAFLTTAGHPDILVLREGGRAEPFNFRVPYPQPYVPRALTFEVPERMDAGGRVVTPLDEQGVCGILQQVAAAKVEAIAVCLLWAIANPVHELRVGELIAQHLPGVPFTLAHRLNPTLREYRRASATAIDASLKPLMSRYLGSLTARLGEAGFRGRTLVVTSHGGMMDAADVARQPIYSLNSGPSMAPIAGRHYARLDSPYPAAIVADTGGTTYDVSLVRKGRIPRTRETWIGQPFRGHMTGFASIDIKSVGAGGGSIARVDSGGVLHVGPQSAGSVPGPACYGTGGNAPTLTDACVVLGYLDPAFFLGGRMSLNAALARQAVQRQIAEPLGLSLMEAAAGIVEVTTENMVQAIGEITIQQGIDPSAAALIGGGGAAGFNSVWIARRLRCPLLIVPQTGAALSAAGALMSEVGTEFREMRIVTSADWNERAVNEVLARLENRSVGFMERNGAQGASVRIDFACEARYAGQVWEIEVPLRQSRLVGRSALDELLEDFHAQHEEIFAVRDPASTVEFVGWSVSVSLPGQPAPGALRLSAEPRLTTRTRKAFFTGYGERDTAVFDLAALPENEPMQGPALVETPFTTIVIDPPAVFRRAGSASLLIEPMGASS